MDGEFYYRKESFCFPLKVNPENIPDTLSGAYALMREDLAHRNATPAAWKLGGTSHTTSSLYSVSVPYFGMLYAGEVWNSPCSPQLKDKRHTSAEVECMLRLGPNLPSILQEGETALMSYPAEMLFDLWTWGVELPFSPISNLGELGLMALVADRCAAGGLVLGPPRAFLRDPIELWRQTSVKLAINGEIKAEGGLPALTASPDICVRRFLVEALRYGFMPMPGQWIASGGLTPCLSLALARRIEVICADQIECTICLSE